MSYYAVSGVDDVLTQIGSKATAVSSTITRFQELKAAASGGQAPARTASVEEGFNWTPVILVGGLALAAFLFLRKK
jgi:hypothetical protein